MIPSNVPKVGDWGENSEKPNKRKNNLSQLFLPEINTDLNGKRNYDIKKPLMICRPGPAATIAESTGRISRDNVSVLKSFS